MAQCVANAAIFLSRSRNELGQEIRECAEGIGDREQSIRHNMEPYQLLSPEVAMFIGDKRT